MTIEATKPRKGPHPLLVIGVGVVVILGALYWFLSTGPAIEGQQGRIVGDGASVLAAADQATFSQLGTVGVEQLAAWEQEGKVALIPVGTRVLVLSVDVPRSRVRILKTGKEYYVQTVAVGR